MGQALSGSSKLIIASTELRQGTIADSGRSNIRALYRHVKSFLAYYHESRTHLSLAKDTPEPRLVHPPALGGVVAIPQVGGLHHRYERRAA